MNLRKHKKDLKDDDISVREKTVDQLAMKNNPKSLKILIETLQKDPAASVRRRAALALGRLGDEGAKEALYQAMLHDKDKDTKRNAAIALAKFGDERAILPLYEFYSAPKSNNFFENIDRARVNLALTELAEMKEKKTIEELVKWFRSKTK